MGFRRAIWVRARDDQGYFAVDATIALLILSIGLILGLNAGQQAWKVSQRALEIERASLLMSHLLETQPEIVGAYSGEFSDFHWRLDMATLGADPNVEICSRSVTVTAKETKRSYGLSTKTPCQTEKPAT